MIVPISFRNVVKNMTSVDFQGYLFTTGQLNANANLIITAGTDTTANTMTQAFWKLCQDPKIFKRLQEEVDTVLEEDGRLDVETTRGLVYLNAVVNEALRLLNPAPSGYYLLDKSLVLNSNSISHT
jgi:cytochrome P450